MGKQAPLRSFLIHKLHRYSSLRRLKMLYMMNHIDDSVESSLAQKQKIQIMTTPVKEHYYTFQLKTDLFTLLYSSLIFRWISSEKLLIVCDTPKIGYQLEIFLSSFRFNCIFLDKEMPMGTNNHFYAQFLKGSVPICIVNSEYTGKSHQFGKNILDNINAPVTIVYFDVENKELLEYHAYHVNTKAIYHFISEKERFIQSYADLEERITFAEFKFDFEQMSHLRYRCEDMFYGIKKSDIKKAKTRKINIELLHSKKMEDFFKKNPQEKVNIIKAIEENKIKNFRPGTGYIPSYLIHQESNQIAEAIRNTYSNPTHISRRNRRRNKKGKMEEYFEALDKGDGSHEFVKF